MRQGIPVVEKKKKEKTRTVPKTGKKKERPRTELITHFRLLKSERAREKRGVGGADRCQYRFICVWRSRPREEEEKCRGKSLFRIAGMNIYDSARERHERRERCCKKGAGVF